METRFMGKDMTVRVEATERHLRAGDILVMGTGDLGRALADIEIKNTVLSTIDSQEACERIISLAASRYKGTGHNKEAMSVEVIQFGDVDEINVAHPGRFASEPVLHHYITKGTAFIESGMYDKAIQEYQKGLEINPDAFSLNFQLALAYQGKGALDVALHHLNKAMDIFPNFIEGHIKLGEVYYQKGQIRRASTEFETAVTLGGNSPDPYLALGSFYYRESLFSYAAKAFRKALEFDPNNQQAERNYQMAVRKAKSITGALAEGAKKVSRGIKAPFRKKK
jgi:tetratricopeptide (TPR) repeat protein